MECPSHPDQNRIDSLLSLFSDEHSETPIAARCLTNIKYGQK